MNDLEGIRRCRICRKTRWPAFVVFTALCLQLVVGVYSQPVMAAYGGVAASHADPEIVRIDEKEYLGAAVERDVVLVDDQGVEFTLGDMLDVPVILVLSYYTCDGACTTINDTLRRVLGKVNDWQVGTDYRVLTLSFDHNDTRETLTHFKHHLGHGTALPQGWTVATFREPEDIQRFTASVGYKFFWEPRDRVFLHPSVYLMLAPDGRVTRYLYSASVTANDIEISVTKAYGKELSPSNVINFLMGACYSYNYRDGKYTLNYPMFVAVGALGLGVGSLVGGSVIMKRRQRA